MALTPDQKINIGVSAASLGSNMLSDHYNRKLQRQTNQQMIDYGNRSYDRERRDAVSDRDFNNQYNDPKQQMQRLKEAGLSPHLVYGNGQVANTSDAPSSSSPSNISLKAPTVNGNMVGDAISAYFNLAQTTAQTDNLKAQADVINTENLLKQAQIRNLDTQTGIGQFDLGYRKTTAEANITKLNLENEKTRADIAYTLDSNQRAELSLNSTLNKNTAEITQIYKNIAYQKIQALKISEEITKSQAERQKIQSEIRHLEAMVKSTTQETRIKQIHEQMYKEGMTPSDPAWMRIIIEGSNDVSTSIQSLINKYKSSMSRKK